MTTLFQDSDFTLMALETAPGKTNLMLVNTSSCEELTVGNASQTEHTWSAAILTAYDGDTDTREIGHYPTQQAAAEALWASRRCIDPMLLLARD